jgi:hypothetical protein
VVVSRARVNHVRRARVGPSHKVRLNPNRSRAV